MVLRKVPGCENVPSDSIETGLVAVEFRENCHSMLVAENKKLFGFLYGRKRGPDDNDFLSRAPRNTVAGHDVVKHRLWMISGFPIGTKFGSRIGELGQ